MPATNSSRLADTAPQKRISLTLKLPRDASADYASTLPLFRLFLRQVDVLVSKAHFRPETLRRIKATREEQVQRLRRHADGERAEERKAVADRGKREKRDALLKGMSADEQRKFLDKERERGQRKSQKKMTVKGG